MKKKANMASSLVRFAFLFVLLAVCVSSAHFQKRATFPWQSAKSPSLSASFSASVSNSRSSSPSRSSSIQPSPSRSPSRSRSESRSPSPSGSPSPSPAPSLPIILSDLPGSVLGVSKLVSVGQSFNISATTTINRVSVQLYRSTPFSGEAVYSISIKNQTIVGAVAQPASVGLHTWTIRNLTAAAIYVHSLNPPLTLVGPDTYWITYVKSSNFASQTAGVGYTSDNCTVIDNGQAVFGRAMYLPDAEPNWKDFYDGIFFLQLE